MSRASVNAARNVLILTFARRNVAWKQIGDALGCTDRAVQGVVSRATLDGPLSNKPSDEEFEARVLERTRQRCAR